MMICQYRNQVGKQPAIYVLMTTSFCKKAIQQAREITLITMHIGQHLCIPYGVRSRTRRNVEYSTVEYDKDPDDITGCRITWVQETQHCHKKWCHDSGTV